MRLIYLTALLSWAISCKDNTGKLSSDLGPPVNPSTKLNAAFLIVDGVYNSELIAPMDVFQHTAFHTEKGINVFTVAQQKDTVITFEGLQILPNYSFSDSIPDIDILVVPSAKHSMDTDLENKELIEFVTRTGKKALYIFSLCDGAFVLAKANLLNTYQCTTFPGDVARFKKTFPQLTVHEGLSFVHDRKSITSVGGAKSYEAALYLVELLYGKKAAEGIGKGLVIDWDLASTKYLCTY